MTKHILFLASTLGLLTACVEQQNAADPNSGYIKELPERVVSIAAPTQDLTKVRLNSVDGCYEYSYVGPVEATFLPLRAINGRPICTR